MSESEQNTLSNSAPEVEQAKEAVEKLRRIIPSEMTPEEQFNANGEYVSLDDVRALIALLSRASQPSVAVEHAKRDVEECVKAWDESQRYSHTVDTQNSRLRSVQAAWDALIAAVSADASRASHQRIETLESMLELKRKSVTRLLAQFKELAAVIEDDEPANSDESAITVRLVKHKLSKLEAAESLARLQAQQIEELQSEIIALRSQRAQPISEG